MITSNRRYTSLLFVGTGWFLFFVLWTLFILGWSQGEVSVANAALSGVIVTGVASAFGILVWFATGKLAWPDSLTPGFFLWQILFAAIFSVGWTISVPVVGVLLEGGSLSELEWTLQNYSWRLLMGVWLYVIIAGLSYAVRSNQRLRQQQQKAARAEALAAEANLAAMRSQLQPHFLFNALHSVSSLIETNPPRASEAMEMLGDLLRYAIRDRSSDTVTLRDEWKFVRDYITLQQIRFGDSLSVDMHLDDDVAAASVPPFILQPVVENAFKHGLSPRQSGGALRISAAASNDVLTLSVTDNGDGSSDHEISQIPIETAGTGLTNLTQRLHAMFGDAASVSVEPLATGGTRSLISIPLEID